MENLDRALAEIETLATRAEIERHVRALAAMAGKTPRTPTQSFMGHIALSYIRGIDRPLFCSEFPVHWPRFKKLWDRLK
jgi:hypothetical protein